METRIETIYGGLGSGKSTYAHKIIDPKETFKLGVECILKDALILKWGSLSRHRAENVQIGISYKATSLETIVKDISEIEKKVLLIDEWSSFFFQSWYKPSKEIIKDSGRIFNAIKENQNLQRVVCVTLDYNPYLPFNLYKKKALWNKLLFKQTDNLVKVDYGVPFKIYPLNQ